MLETVPAPNPYFVDNAWVSVKLKGGAEKLEVRLYSAAYNFVTRFENEGPYGEGWVNLPLVLDDLPNGVYFIEVWAYRESEGHSRGRPETLYIAK